MGPRYKKEERDSAINETRQAILQVAAEALAQKGYEGANVNHIAEEAGFSIGTFYNYFPSKQELMLAFIDEIGQKHANYIIDQVIKAKAPIQKPQAFFEAGFTFVEANLTEAWAIFITLNGPDFEFKARLFQAYQPLFQLVGDEIIEPGSVQGVFRQVDPGSTAGLLMLIYLGTGSQMSPEGKHWIRVEQVADFVKNALRPE